MKKIVLSLVAFAMLFTTNALAQNAYIPHLIKEMQRKNDIQLKSGVVGSYPRHTEEFNWTTAWVLFRTLETSYTSFGEASAIEYTQGSNKTRRLFSYDAQHNGTEHKYQNWNGTAWVDVERWTSTYNASGYETETRHETWNGAWVLQDGTQNTYTMDGNRISVVTMKEWNMMTQTWDNSLRETYTYSGTSIYFGTIIVEKWEVNQWVNQTKVEYSWTGDKVSTSIMYDWTNNVWVVSGKIVNEYPDNLTTVMTIFTDDGSGGWMAVSRTTSTVDSHGNATLQQTEMNMGTWTIFAAIRYTLTYDGNNLTQRITETFTFGGNWTNTKKEVFSNFASLSTDITLMPDIGLTVFPNPAVSETMVRISQPNPGQVTLTLTSITGQKVLEETITATGSDVNFQLNLSKVGRGSYILVARDKQGVSIGKTHLIKE
ncbi:MAG: T9SS type A sorting domain-containing protein [Bacteroidales bacterium]|jgi:hypothetical protein